MYLARWPKATQPDMLRPIKQTQSEGSMMHRRFAFPSISAVLLLLAATTFAQTGAKHFSGDAWWAHVQFLADDSLEGRETGSEGLRKAQAYVVDQFKKAGLEPAGTDGFYQPVKFVSREIVESESSAALISGGKCATARPWRRCVFFDARQSFTRRDHREAGFRRLRTENP